MEPRGIFISMTVPAEVLAAALAEDASGQRSRRSRPLALSQTIS